ncbi:MAG TPA: hypothetical protein VN436_05935 [Holophaga sp.]|nr:hypothetical protein [Holophaga sp.]
MSTNARHNTLRPSFKDILVHRERGFSQTLRCEHHPFAGIVIVEITKTKDWPVICTEVFVPHLAVSRLRKYIEEVEHLETTAQETTGSPAYLLREIGERMR